MGFIGVATGLIIGMVVYSEVEQSLGCPSPPVELQGDIEISMNGGIGGAANSLSDNVGRGNVPVSGNKYNESDGMVVGKLVTHIKVESTFGGQSVVLGLYNGGSLVAQTAPTNIGIGTVWVPLETPYLFQSGDGLYFGGVSLTGFATVLRGWASIPSGAATEYIDLDGPTWPLLPTIFTGHNPDIETNASFGFELRQTDTAAQIAAYEQALVVYAGNGEESCTKAKSITWSVLTVLPVSLFMGLFGVFGGFTKNQF